MKLIQKKSTILVVDDQSENLTVMHGLLKDHYRVIVANHGTRALALARAENPPGLILLDVMMPEMDGFEVCRQLKADPATTEIPVVFLTAKNDIADETLGFELGAVDYITKPISPPLVLARVKTHLLLKAAADFLRDQNQYLETEVANRTREIGTIQDVTIIAMASLAETRDNETGNHIRRTQNFVKILAEQLQQHPRFAHYLTPSQIEILHKSAPLHDIGKVGIPDRILLKPGPLTVEEFTIMKTHCALGRDAIVAAERVLLSPNSFLTCAREIAYGHQEKWDGSGYPEGLQGDAIPVSARLMALADVYDALTSVRVYKAAMPHLQAKEIIVAGRGRHFDPDIVDAFLESEDEFREIADRFSDKIADPPEAMVISTAARDSMPPASS